MNPHHSVKTTPITTAEAVETIDKSFYRQVRELAGLISVLHIQKNIKSDEMKGAAREFIKHLLGQQKNKCA
ncbi:MAG: hypothetical protein P8Y42_09850 [Exilibacterium sp.]